MRDYAPKKMLPGEKVAQCLERGSAWCFFTVGKRVYLDPPSYGNVSVAAPGSYLPPEISYNSTCPYVGDQER